MFFESTAFSVEILKINLLVHVMAGVKSTHQENMSV